MRTGDLVKVKLDRATIEAYLIGYRGQQAYINPKSLTVGNPWTWGDHEKRAKYVDEKFHGWRWLMVNRSQIKGG